MIGDRLGNWLSWQRMRAKAWGRLALGFLALLVASNLFLLHAHHPHFGLEAIPGFWAGFGLFFALAMILVLKKVVAHIIGVPEDFYDRSK